MSQKKNKDIPADLNIKIGSPEEVIWTNVKKNTEAEIKEQEAGLMVNKEILALAEKKIVEEQEKFK